MGNYVYAVQRRTREGIWDDPDHYRYARPDRYGEWSDWHITTSNNNSHGLFTRITSAVFSMAGKRSWRDNGTSELRLVRACISDWGVVE